MLLCRSCGLEADPVTPEGLAECPHCGGGLTEVCCQPELRNVCGEEMSCPCVGRGEETGVDSN